MGCHFLLQGIFPTQGSNPGLLHCRQTLYQLSDKGSPESAVGTHISPSSCTSSHPLPIPPPRLIQSPCLSSLRHTANSYWPSILHMVMPVSMLVSPHISPSPPFSLCPYVYSLCLFLSLQINSSVPAFYIPYICINIQFLSFSF